MQGNMANPSGVVIEADETYVGPTRRGHKVWQERVKDEEEMGLRPKTPHRSPFEGKIAVFGMMESGGRVRQRSRPRTRFRPVPPICLDG